MSRPSSSSYISLLEQRPCSSRDDGQRPAMAHKCIRCAVSLLHQHHHPPYTYIKTRKEAVKWPSGDLYLFLDIITTGFGPSATESYPSVVKERLLFFQNPPLVHAVFTRVNKSTMLSLDLTVTHIIPVGRKSELSSVLLCAQIWVKRFLFPSHSWINWNFQSYICYEYCLEKGLSFLLPLLLLSAQLSRQDDLNHGASLGRKSESIVFCDAQHKRERTRGLRDIYERKDWTGIFDEVRSSGSRCRPMCKEAEVVDILRTTTTRFSSALALWIGQQQGQLDMFISQAFVIPRNKDREWNQWIVFDILSSPPSKTPFTFKRCIVLYSWRR